MSLSQDVDAWSEESSAEKGQRSQLCYVFIVTRYVWNTTDEIA